MSDEKCFICGGPADEKHPTGHWSCQECRDETKQSRFKAETDRLNGNDHLIDGYTFFTSEAASPEPRWGAPGEVVWAQNEPLMIFAPTGVGKTTLSQHLALAMIGVGPSNLLGFPVIPIDGTLLYIAADRPAQAARSGARLIGTMDEDVLRERLRVWRGPLPFNLSTDEPRAFADWIEDTGCTAVVVDSLMNVATDLSKDEVGSRVAQSANHVVARGMELVFDHHDRKIGRDSSHKRTPDIDDVYGSRFLSAAMGSVVYLKGRPGDPIVRFHQLKAPAGEIPPFDIVIDHATGAVDVDQTRTPFEILKRSAGLNPREFAQALYGPSADRSDIEKARRQAEKLIDAGKATRKGGGRRASPVTYYAIQPE